MTYESYEADIRQRRAAERNAWQVMGDRSLTITATVLGLSIVFLTSDTDLTDTWLLRSSWIVFAIGVVAGLIRLSVDWFITLQDATLTRAVDDPDPTVNWTRVSRAVQVVNFICLLTGLLLLLSFGWLNL